MNGNQVVQSLWIGNSLSVLEQLAATSYLRNGHDFHLYTYNKIENVPAGVIIHDGNEILREEFVFRDSRSGYASFADWFRFKLLYKKGGWWVDMDSVCVRHFNVEEEYCIANEYLGLDKKNQIANICNIKMPAGAEILADCICVIENEFSNLSVVPWGAFGIRLFREVLLNYDSADYTKPADVFCPIPGAGIKAVVDKDENIEIPEQTLAVHLYNEMWRILGVNKRMNYAPECLYEKLKHQFLQS